MYFFKMSTIDTDRQTNRKRQTQVQIDSQIKKEKKYIYILIYINVKQIDRIRLKDIKVDRKTNRKGRKYFKTQQNHMICRQSHIGN